MMKIKKKNIIITGIIILALILPKIFVKPINQGVVPMEPVNMQINEETKRTKKSMEGKGDKLKKLLEENNIKYESYSEDVANAILGRPINEPLEEFTFKYFLTGYSNKIDEISRISFNVDSNKEFNLDNYKLLTKLINMVCEKEKYDYITINEKVNEILKNDKMPLKGEFNEKLGEYDLNIRIYELDKDKALIEFEFNRKY